MPVLGTKRDQPLGSAKVHLTGAGFADITTFKPMSPVAQGTSLLKLILPGGVNLVLR